MPAGRVVKVRRLRMAKGDGGGSGDCSPGHRKNSVQQTVSRG